MRREGLCVKIHIVQKGDTLWKIAKKYGVNFETLKKMNSQLSNPDMLMPGMKIKVPENTSSSAQKGSNTKINFGTVKEAPISSGSSNVKESIKPETQTAPIKPKEMPIVTPPPAVKEMPIQPMEIKKEKPVKEMPKMPYVAPQASVKPVVPEIDINNYYLMNMAKMEMQTPPPMPIIKEAPKVKEKPVMKEKPKKMEKPMTKPMPMPQPMPQFIPEYCPPMIPYYDPCCAPPFMMHPYMGYQTPYFNHSYMTTGPVYHQPHFQQPYWGFDDDMGDSSSFHYGHHDSSHFMGGKHGEYYHHQQGYNPAMSTYGQFPVQGTQGHYQQPGFGHYGHESSSHYGMESPSHMMDHHYMHQQQYIPFDGYIPKGCGCSDTGTQGTYYQPMNQYDHQSMNQPMGQFDHQGMSQSMGQYDHQGMGQPMGQYDFQGMGQSMNQYENQGMSQPMGQFGQQGMTQPMYQQPAQQPFFQDSQFHQRYGGQQSEAGSPSYNPNGQHVIPHIEPAAFDMPRTQEESSEQEGQS